MGVACNSTQRETVCSYLFFFCAQDLLKHSQEGEREKRRLSEQVDRLQLKNEELLRKIDRMKRKRDQNTSQDGKLQKTERQGAKNNKLVCPLEPD